MAYRFPLQARPARVEVSTMMCMNEIIFLVEEAPEGEFAARALGESIFTKADDFAALEGNVRGCRALPLRTE